MPWLRPVRSAFAAGEALFDRILCVVGAVAFSQVPEFMQQYLQRLGGHLDEARRQLEEFRAAAAQSGLTLDQLIHNTSVSDDPSVVRLAGVIQATQARVAELAADQGALQSAHLLSRPFVFLRHADWPVVKGTWAIFEPAVPTTVEGLIYALFGIAFLLIFYHGAVRLPIRAAYRRRCARRAAGGGTASTLAVLAFLLAAAAVPRAAAQPAISETEAKAAFLFNFPQFVEWPSAAFADPAAPFIIGVGGDDELAAILARLVRGESIGSHPMQVRTVRTRADAAGCQALYVAGRFDWLADSSAVQTRPILTVGDSDSFTRDGGIIRFVADRNHLRLHINIAAAHKASLAISSKLLRVAEVESGGGR